MTKHVFTVTVETSKPIAALADHIGNRLWTMDGVTDVSVSEKAAVVEAQQHKNLTLAAFDSLAAADRRESKDQSDAIRSAAKAAL